MIIIIKTQTTSKCLCLLNFRETGSHYVWKLLTVLTLTLSDGVDVAVRQWWKVLVVTFIFLMAINTGLFMIFSNIKFVIILKFSRWCRILCFQFQKLVLYKLKLFRYFFPRTPILFVLFLNSVFTTAFLLFNVQF